MSVSASSASPDAVQLVMLKKQLTAEATQTAQLLEGMRPQPSAAPPPRPTPPPGTWYL